MTIRIALAQIKIIPGRPALNAANMLEYIEKARLAGANIIIFPELSLPGYLLGDLWQKDYFLRECQEAGEKIIAASRNITVIFGNIAVDWKKRNMDGYVRKYNACFVAQNGCLIKDSYPYPFRIKTALPNYRLFDDNRHFFSSAALAVEMGKPPQELLAPVNLSVNGHRLSLGCLVCEDGWSEFYPLKVADSLAKSDIFINISSSPFSLGKNADRHRIFAALAKTHDAPLIYVNHVGVQNNGKNIYTYDGASCIYQKNGELHVQAPAFEEALMLCEFDPKTRICRTDTTCTATLDTQQEMYTALEYGAKQFLKACNISRMAIGLSGGIDSAVTAAFYAHILGRENVLLINMPSQYNSAKTKDLARTMAENLQAPYAQIPIEESTVLTKKQIEAVSIDGHPLVLSPLALENIQARDRSGRILAAAAAAFGGAFSCNANKSELAVGYGTFYGDLAGALALIGDLWKHQVYALGRYLNEEIYGREIIPAEMFSIMPSAELSDAQTVGAGGDPLIYPYHDYLLQAFVEQSLSPIEIASWYLDGTLAEKIGCPNLLPQELFPAAADFFADLERWWLAFTGFAVAKRIQSPPLVSISRRPFGFDLRESQMPAHLPEEYIKIKKQALK